MASHAISSSSRSEFLENLVCPMPTMAVLSLIRLASTLGLPSARYLLDTYSSSIHVLLALNSDLG